MNAEYGFFDFVAMIAWQWLELTVIVGVVTLLGVILCNWYEEGEKRMKERRKKDGKLDRQH